MDPPTDRVSSPEDRSRLVAEAIAHAEAQEAHYRHPPTSKRPTGRWKGTVALVLFTVAGYVALFSPTWVLGPPPPRLAPADRGRGVVAALQIQARQIETFQARNGRLPRTLEEVPHRLPGIRFVRSNTRQFQLVGARPDGAALVYDSSNPDPAFAEIERELSLQPGS